MASVKELVGLGKPALPKVAERSVTVFGPPDAVWRAWQDPEFVRRLFAPFAEVTGLGEGRLHWVVPGLDGVAWDTHVVEERPNELLRWSPSGDGLGVEAQVRLRPAPADRGTVLTFSVGAAPVTGPLAEKAERLERAIVARSLRTWVPRAFKWLFEAGEIPTLHHQPAARDGGRDP